MPIETSTPTLPPSTPDAAPAPAARSRRLRPASFWWLPAAVAFALLRLPSFLEPHWYTDEAGYASTGREILSGKLPYSEIWNNKPPLHLVTAGAVVKLFGSSETALHLVTFLTGAVALAAMAYMSRRLLGTWKAATALLAAAVLLGFPFVDAELMIPESVLIAPVAWAAAIIVVRLHQRRIDGWLWAALAGMLAALALGYQQTAIADVGAFGLILLVHPAARRRHILAYVAAVVAVTAAWVVPLLVLVRPGTLWFALAGFYVTPDYNYSTSPGAHGLPLAILLVAVVAAAVGGAVLARRRGVSHPGWMFAVWAVATLCVPAAAQQPFPHFLAPAVIPCALTLAAILPSRRPSWRPIAAIRANRAGLLTAVPLAASLVAAGLLARSAGLDWIPAAASLGSNGYRNLETYYPGAWQAATGGHSWSEWEAEFDLRAPADTATAEWLLAHGFRGARAVVWSSDAWPYLLADLPVLLPTAPIYNNEVLLGSNGEVTNRVRALRPAIILAESDDLANYPEIEVLLKSDYREVFSSTVDHVMLRDDLSVPTD